MQLVTATNIIGEDMYKENKSVWKANCILILASVGQKEVMWTLAGKPFSLWYQMTGKRVTVENNNIV